MMTLAVVMMLTVMMVNSGFGLLLNEMGTCSKKCKPRGVAESLSDDKLFPCSCESSCVTYGDCCSDSPFRMKGVVSAAKNRGMVCLPLAPGTSEILSASAVGNCPSSYNLTSRFCENGLGYLKPVTSRVTGTTYANVYCAICNGDASNLLTWDANIHCCAEARQPSVYKHLRFESHNNNLWLMLERRDILSSRLLCQCQYVPRPGRSEFLKQTNLRSCSRTEISKCAATWRNRETRTACSSYLDPVYVRDRVYRNPHCAVCNYELESSLSCVPGIVSQLWLRGFTDNNRIISFCKDRGLDYCLHYMSVPRGRAYSLSLMMSIQRTECLPSSDLQCCPGYMYHMRSGKCRKVGGKS